MKKIILLALNLFLLSLASNAQAALISYNFDGYLTNSYGTGFAPTVSNNTDPTLYRFSGNFSFDTTQLGHVGTIDLHDSTVTSAHFLTPANVTFSFAGGSTVNLTDLLKPTLFPNMEPSGFGQETTWFMPPKNNLYYEYSGEGSTKTKTQTTSETLLLQLGLVAYDAPSFKTYLGALLVKHAYEIKNLLDSSKNRAGGFLLAGQIDSVTAVPLPGAILMFGSSLIGLAAVRRKFRT